MILLITFCVTFIIQLYFYAYLFSKYTLFKSGKTQHHVHAVSLIICAKNEALNLGVLLPKLKTQEFPEFEIVLIDDNSSDLTHQVMLDFKESCQSTGIPVHIEHISGTESKGKKFALTKGILAARYKHILLTDADCKPLSEKWIKEMSSHFRVNTSIVLGYGAYDKIKNSFLNKLIRFETLLTAIQYFSYALNGKAYMGVGRNLAYQKSAFIEADGFEGHKHIKSGDDDLFVSQIAASKQIEICDQPNGFTSSIPHHDLSSWIKQKRRHITTSAHYRTYHKVMLGIFYFSQFLFYFLAAFALITNTYLDIILVLIVIRFGFWYLTIYKSASRLNEKDLIAFGPLYEISIIFMQLYIYVKNIISPPKHW